MKQTENKAFRAPLVMALRSVAEVNVQPIESGSTGDGIPDVYVCHEALSVWMELKKAEIRGNESIIKYRPGQRAWLAREKAAGGTAVLGIFVPDGSGFYFLHSNFQERYAYPLTEYNLHLPKINGATLLAWLHALPKDM